MVEKVGHESERPAVVVLKNRGNWSQKWYKESDIKVTGARSGTKSLTSR